MKTGLFFLCSPLLLFLLYSNSHGGNTILLKDAQNSKQVELIIRGVTSDVGIFAVGKHYGECIEFEVENLTSLLLDIKVETGRILICENDSVQNMMLTRDLVFAINGRERIKYKAYAMCIEEHDRSPNSKSLFHLGEIAEGDLLELAMIIDKNNYQGVGGQSAVWTIIGKKDTSSIWGSNAEEKKFLRKYVSELRGETSTKNEIVPETIIFIETPEFNISGNIKWTMKKKGSADLLVYDEQGNYITAVFKKRKFDTGEQESNFRIISCLLEPGTKYLVRLKVNDLTQEELVVMSE